MAQFTHCQRPVYKNLDAEIINNRRWYTVRENVKYPSVTTILGHGEKLWLQEWRDSLGHEAADIESARCSTRGENVHLMCERYLKNEQAPTREQMGCDIRIFNQLRPILHRINNIRAQEIPLFSDEYKLAGRVDVVAEYEGELAIIDFKTSNNNKPTSMVNDYFLQSTGYALMYNEMFHIPITNIVIIIGVERGMAPMVYKKTIGDYIQPLADRINTFYDDLEKEQQ